MEHTNHPQHKSNHRQKTTAEHRKNIPTIIIIAIMLGTGLTFAVPLTIALISIITIPSSSAEDTFLKYIFIAVYIAIIGTIIAIPIGYAIGKIRAKHKILRENHYIKSTNPYQYYKELPNNFGIGVASLLNNSTIENEKDIVAAILDLCAQGYLHLSKHSDHYVIRIPITPPHNHPLSNEAYLLELIRNNSIANIDYQKWYQLCVNDGVNLELFRPFKFPTDYKNNSTYSQKRQKARRNQDLIEKLFKWAFIIPLFLTIIWQFVGPYFMPAEEVGKISGTAFIVLIIILITLMMSQFASVIHTNLRQASRFSYKSMLERHLQRTDKGIVELQKLHSFKAFLAQFNTFVDKDPESVVLWSRYLSYAQVFGLTKEIMQSGYSELIDNAAFKIDSINNITLSNISFQ